MQTRGRRCDGFICSMRDRLYDSKRARFALGKPSLVRKSRDWFVPEGWRHCGKAVAEFRRRGGDRDCWCELAAMKVDCWGSYVGLRNIEMICQSNPILNRQQDATACQLPLFTITFWAA